MKDKIDIKRVMFILLLTTLLADTFGQKTQDIGHVTGYNAKLTLSFEDDVKLDTLVLSFWPIVSVIKANNPSQVIPVISDRHNNFTFNIAMPVQSGYVSIRHWIYKNGEKYFEDSFLSLYLLEAGDDVVMKINNLKSGLIEERNIKLHSKFEAFFYGSGAEKYSIRDKIEKEIYAQGEDDSVLLDEHLNFLEDSYLIKTLNSKTLYLDSVKDKLSGLAYSVLKADIIGKAERDILRNLLSKNKMGVTKVINGYENHINTSINSTIPDTIKSYSYFYSLFWNDYNMALYKQHCLDKHTLTAFYQYVKEHNIGILREKMMTMAILHSNKADDEIKELLKDAVAFVKTKGYANQLADLSEKNKSNYAYNFDLPDVKGNRISLKQFRGKVVFMDYWFTGCTGCSHYYLNHLKQIEEEFKDNDGIVFITISSDVNRSGWVNSINSGKYTSTHIFNLFTEGLGTKHPVIYQYNFAAGPTPLVIDKNGKIISFNEPILRNAETLKKFLFEAINSGK